MGWARRKWELSAPLRALIRYLPKADLWRTVLLTLAVGAEGVTPPLFSIATGVLVGAVPAALLAGPDSAAADRVLFLVALTGALFAARQVVSPLRQLVVEELAFRLDNGLKQRVMAATSAPVGIAHLEDPRSLDKIAIARGLEGNIGASQALLGLANLAARYLAGGLSTLIVMRYQWWLGLGMAVAYLLNSARSRREFRTVVDVLMGEAGTLRRADYVRDLALTPAASKETRVFGLADWVHDRYRETWLSAMLEVWHSRRRTSRVFAVMVTVATSVKAVGFVYVGLAGARGELTLGTAVVLFQAMVGISAFSAIGQDEMSVAKGSAPIPAALVLERAVAVDQATVNAGRLPAAGLPRHTIAFESVSFDYPGSGARVFAGLDLVIEAGQSLAVVGVNGAGKTTLVKLLARLYDPTEGRITVDGIDLRDLEAVEWQRRVAAIFQDFVRYELSARDNVGFGATELAVDDDALDRAAARAGASGVVARLESGWSTVLNRQYAGGTDLSGGEWQRIALARALLAVEAGAGVLVLDEPTANLDVRAEAEIYDRFLDLTHGLTSIVISHRFSTVRRAERIVVLEHGRVIEDGSHDTLVAAGGRYATMYALQAARFADDTAGEAVTEVGP